MEHSPYMEVRCIRCGVTLSFPVQDVPERPRCYYCRHDLPDPTGVYVRQDILDTLREAPDREPDPERDRADSRPDNRT